MLVFASETKTIMLKTAQISFTERNVPTISLGISILNVCPKRVKGFRWRSAVTVLNITRRLIKSLGGKFATKKPDNYLVDFTRMGTRKGIANPLFVGPPCGILFFPPI